MKDDLLAWFLRWRWRLLPVVVLLALALPAIEGGILGQGYLTRVGAMTMIYVILALGLNLVPGFTGLLDLGYVGFFGIGAYTAALLAVDHGWTFEATLPAACVHAAIWGVLLGAPTLRLTGDYFAIVTFGFSELVVLGLTNEGWLTGGPNGVRAIPAPSLFGWEMDANWEVYVLLLAAVLAVFLLTRRLEYSRVGRAWFAIRDDPLAAESCGVNLVRYKVLAFALSAGIAGIGGAFFAHLQRFIDPSSFILWESVLVLCLVVLGGMGSRVGVVCGALVLYPLTQFLRDWLGDLTTWAQQNDVAWVPGDLANAHFLILGVVLVLIMRARPAGLLPHAPRRKGEA